MTITQTSAIKATAFSVDYGKHRVVDRVSLDIPRGSVVGLLGRNGAGKSTLIKAMLGFIAPSEGSCALLGEDSRTLSDDLKARLGIVMQNPVFYGWLTGHQLIEYTAHFYANWDTAMAARLTTQWKLPMDRRVSEYSGGEVQKLACILALSHNAKLFILDEPASSLDPVSRRQLLAELVDIASGEGKTILFSTHIVSDLERIADHVAFMKAGNICLHMPLDTLKESIKRLRFSPQPGTPPLAAHRHIANLRQDANCTIALATGFNALLKADLEKQVAGPIEVEDLSLEEIFLELHRD